MIQESTHISIFGIGRVNYVNINSFPPQKLPSSWQHYLHVLVYFTLYKPCIMMANYVDSYFHFPLVCSLALLYPRKLLILKIQKGQKAKMAKCQIPKWQNIKTQNLHNAQMAKGQKDKTVVTKMIRECSITLFNVVRCQGVNALTRVQWPGTGALCKFNWFAHCHVNDSLVHLAPNYD